MRLAKQDESEGWAKGRVKCYPSSAVRDECATTLNTTRGAIGFTCLAEVTP